MTIRLLPLKTFSPYNRRSRPHPLESGARTPEQLPAIEQLLR